MNTTMADSASERLDAQIADALFGQPGMSKLDVANRLRELRGNGGALLGSAAYPAAWMWPHPEDGSMRFTADGNAATEAANVGRAVSALYRVPVQEGTQPSPAVPGDTLPARTGYAIATQWRAQASSARVGRNTLIRCANELEAALAARPPVGAAVKDSLTVGGGQAVAWMTHHDEPMLFPTAAEAAAYCEDDEQPVPLFRSPAQAADLGQVREALQAAARSLRTIAESTKDTEFLEAAGEIRAYAGSRANCAEQALMDSQAVGNGWLSLKPFS